MCIRDRCDDEGELYRLFHAVNSLAAVLNAHADNRLREKEFLKNTISDISHQLKTPLAALNIYNGLLQDEDVDPSLVKEFADLSEQELDRIETLVQNLLKITKLDAGSIMIEKETENVADMMGDIELHFAYRARPVSYTHLDVYKRQDKEEIYVQEKKSRFRQKRKAPGSACGNCHSCCVLLCGNSCCKHSFQWILDVSDRAGSAGTAVLWRQKGHPFKGRSKKFKNPEAGHRAGSGSGACLFCRQYLVFTYCQCKKIPESDGSGNRKFCRGY